MFPPHQQKTHILSTLPWKSGSDCGQYMALSVWHVSKESYTEALTHTVHAIQLKCKRCNVMYARVHCPVSTPLYRASSATAEKLTNALFVFCSYIWNFTRIQFLFIQFCQKGAWNLAPCRRLGVGIRGNNEHFWQHFALLLCSMQDVF